MTLQLNLYSYDKTIGLWALGGSERETGKITAPYSVLQGCKAPVLEIAVTPRCVAGGGKDGGLLSWDVESGSCLMKVRGKFKMLYLCFIAILFNVEWCTRQLFHVLLPYRTMALVDDITTILISTTPYKHQATKRE